MKKVIMMAAVAAALVSCQSKANKAQMAEADSLAVEEAMSPMVEATEVYEGTLPSSDGPIDYVLTLDMLADSNDTVYTLDMTYLDANKQPTTKKMSTKGKPVVIQKAVKDKKTKKDVMKKAIKLNPSDGSAPLYFVIANDTTLTWVSNDGLEESASDQNYDIIRVK